MTKVSDTVTVRQIADNERRYWDEHIQTFTHVHPFNAYEWGTVRKVDGWTPIYLVAERGGRFCGGLLLLSKRLPFLPYRIFYGPHGPVFEAQDLARTFRAIHAKVLEVARKSRAIFMRIDPNIREDQGAEFEQEFAGSPGTAISNSAGPSGIRRATNIESISTSMSASTNATRRSIAIPGGASGRERRTGCP